MLPFFDFFGTKGFSSRESSCHTFTDMGTSWPAWLMMGHLLVTAIASALEALLWLLGFLAVRPRLVPSLIEKRA